MAEMNVDFTFEVKASSLDLPSGEAASILRIAENWLDKIYGEEHCNWHEICLAVKAKAYAYLLTLELKSPLSRNKKEELAKRFTAQTMLEYEL